MKIFTTESLRAIDKATIEAGEAGAIQLIEQVAEGVVAQILKRWKPSRPTAVFAGPGNNGADALAVARLLIEQGFKPDIYLFNIGGSRLSAECRTERDMLLSLPNEVRFTEIVNQLTLPELSRQWLVVDGLFGSGLRDGLTGGFMALVRKINESGAAVVSIDVPSGLHGDWNPQAISRNIIHATLTLGVGFPHIAFLFRENSDTVGEWLTLPLSLSRSAVAATQSSFYYVERADVASLLEHRNPFAGKNEFGRLLLVAGSYGMAGASILAARGALRAGAGRVTVHAPRCNVMPLQTAIPEAMVNADRGETIVNEIPQGGSYDAVAIGPGLGRGAATADALERFLKSHNNPVVLDADALNIIADRPGILNFLPRLSVLTPHSGEFDRMFGPQATDEMRLLKAMEVARRYDIVIVLKSRYTATVRPDGKTYFNSTGCPAMATPGSGDVLTGVISAFIAHGMSPDMASVAGVYVHGVAGEMAAIRQGEYGVLASDIANMIGRAIAETMQ